MSSLIGTADCIHCNKVKSGSYETVNGWLCNECYKKIYYGVRRFRPAGMLSKYYNEYDKLLTDEEIEKAFAEIEEGRRLREESKATLTSPDGKIIIDQDKNLIYLSEDIKTVVNENYISPAHDLSKLSKYYLLFESAILSKTDNAIKYGNIMLEFEDCQIRYEKIPLGKPKGFFNFQRKMYYRKHAKELLMFLAEVTGQPHGKEAVVTFKQH